MFIVRAQLALAGYEVQEKLYEGSHSLIYRVNREDSPEERILKVLKTEHPTSRQVAQFNNEYVCTHTLKVPGLRKALAQTRVGAHHGLLLEYVEGKTLRTFAQEHILDLATFLQLAITIAQHLEMLHQEGLIHKDINPNNIMVHPQTHETVLIDFGISARTNHTLIHLGHPAQLEGTLAYISPEQTGRMNRQIDHRSDLYSLGATLYELYTGVPPFQADDELGLIHAHIARQPKPPHTHTTPQLQGSQTYPWACTQLSAIIMKLLAKRAEERYQSAFGLRMDLEQLQTHHSTPPPHDLALGQHDLSSRFQIPQKLYGRQRELSTLRQLFSRVTHTSHATSETKETTQPAKSLQSTEANSRTNTDPQKQSGEPEKTVARSRTQASGQSVAEKARGAGGESVVAASSKHEGSQPGPELAPGQSALVLVNGYSGVGKSALVHELHRDITQVRGHFLSGKFDQFQKDIPYAALRKAFAQLCQQLLSEPAEALARWKEEIQDAVGANGQIILDVVPDLRWIIGPQPPVAARNPQETENRFHLYFLNFVKAVCSPHNPLILFLDDLQWIDPASLKLLKYFLLDEDLRHFLLIGAYRDNEVDPAHPLQRALDELAQENTPIYAIHLDNLQPTDVHQLLVDSLHTSASRSQELCDLIYQKTQGNAFFTRQFLHTLVQEGWLQFVTTTDTEQSPGWRWDIAQIEKQNITDNVVELMTSKITRLPQEGGRALQLASCLGNPFALDRLALLLQMDPSQTLTMLQQAVQEGLLRPLHGHTRTEHQRTFFEFAHDRVQQAAYALVPQAEKEQLHLRIGRLLLEQMTPQEQEENLIELVGHFNAGRAHIETSQERTALAHRNLEASRKARNAIAYEAAFRYASTGLTLLETQPWQTQYALVFALGQEVAHAAYLCGKLQEAEAHIKTMLTHLKNPQEKAEILLMQSTQYSTMGRMQDSIQAGLDGLALLGIKLPHRPGPLTLMRELLATRLLWKRESIPDLLDRPTLQDPEKKLAMKLLIELGPTTYLTGNKILSVTAILKMVHLTLRHGNSPEAAVSYVRYGVLLSVILKDVQSGFAFGKLGMALNEAYPDAQLKSKALLGYVLMIYHWNQHWSQLTPLLQEGAEAATQSGDLFDLCMHCHHAVTWDPTLPLDVQADKLEQYLHIVQKTHFQDQHDAFMLVRQKLKSLRGLLPGRDRLDDEDFDEDACLQRMTGHNYLTGILEYHRIKAELHLLYENPQAALSHIQHGEKERAILWGLPSSVRYCMASFLATAGHLPAMPPPQRRKAWRRLRREHRTMRQWARHCPSNFAHCQWLMEAELARLSKRHHKAAELYEKAIASAKEHRWLQDEALANEYAARFYLARGWEKVARSYMQEAHALYRMWGATGKCTHLEERYPYLLLPSNNNQSASHRATYSTRSSGKTITRHLDLNTVIKSSQTISGEIVLQSLLKRLLHIVMENAGAQRALLLLEEQGQLYVEAEGSIDASVHVHHPPLPFADFSRCARSVILYTHRTHDPTVLHSATSEGAFRTDPAILAHNTQSILCAPLLHQGQLTGLIYLENALVKGAFNAQRLELVQLLSSQAAVSIQNARLFAQMEDKVAARTEELADALTQIQDQHQQLKDAQVKIVQSEKMASLGTLVAGIAHEINNPANFTYVGAQNLQRRLEDFRGVLRDLSEGNEESLHFFEEQFVPLFNNITAVLEGSERIKDIVKSLRTFSRLDEAEKKAARIVENIQSTLSLVQASYKDIAFHCDFVDDPEIECYPAQLNQVFMNLMMNACQAITSRQKEDPEAPPGHLHLRTRLAQDQLEIAFEDNGKGIPQEIQDRLFEPFFTTKPVGEGSGLGLSISFGIIEKHHGQLTFSSQPGQGSTFRILLPCPDTS